ncbi:hypothetical protein [Skermanella pratensis]|uniref:hypothetical protein n=1 Tax=Skermanella pratensis TaxID=2233999 RepID=UPI0013019890|nr:hypothetical protein [Skermanella pratensis]
MIGPSLKPHRHHRPFWPFARRLLAAAALVAGTAGCANNPVLDLLGGGSGLPPEGAEQGLIRRATDEDKTWPNLASVPPRPTAFSKPAERQALMDRLKVERGEDVASGAELDARAPVAPARQAPPTLPAMGGEVPPPVSAIQIPQAPPTAP